MYMAPVCQYLLFVHLKIKIKMSQNMVLDVLGCIAYLVELRQGRHSVTPFIDESALGSIHGLL